MLGLAGDDEPMVREAAVIAAGRFGSTSTVGVLRRVLWQDASPAVRRTAAWAPRQTESGEATPALAEALGRDADSRVREMFAWAIGAIGAIEERCGTAALLAAVRGDANHLRVPAVRE